MQHLRKLIVEKKKVKSEKSMRRKKQKKHLKALLIYTMISFTSLDGQIANNYPIDYIVFNEDTLFREDKVLSRRLSLKYCDTSGSELNEFNGLLLLTYKKFQCIIDFRDKLNDSFDHEIDQMSFIELRYPRKLYRNEIIFGRRNILNIYISGNIIGSMGYTCNNYLLKKNLKTIRCPVY